MAYKKLKIICDADDVLISCNEYALQLLSQVKGQYYNVSRITKWGLLDMNWMNGWNILNMRSFMRTSQLFQEQENF